MIKELFGAIRDFLKEYMSHRLFPLTILFFVLFGILIYRLFVLQIVDGQEYLDNFIYKQERTVTVPASRGIIYDRNGKELAYNEISYSVRTVTENLLIYDTRVIVNVSKLERAVIKA